jgi:LuxR family maltose regulon positive regulatory protein
MPDGMHGERRHRVAQQADRITSARAIPPEESAMSMATDLVVDLVATKLLAPPPRTGIVARPRLLRRLDETLRHRLTLLSAPPGSGKTTLLAEWLDRQRRQARHLSTVWVGLDEGDDDPTRFWLVIAAALEHILPGSTGSAPALLRAPQPPTARAVLTALVNGLAAAPGTVLLVLDDYHAIAAQSIHEQSIHEQFIHEQSIHDALAYLIDHLPSHVHLVLTSRADPPLPLARLRARGELVELRADDLRFTADEAASFLAETMALRLDPEQVALLQTRTEGWIAGLQLAALSLRGQGDVTAFLETFAGSHRYIVDYLADEVLDRQPPRVRDFLLRTSPLNQLCGPLCDAVTGERDGREALTTLERANLFLIPLDHERRWFRYHALFAGALRERLRTTLPDEIAALHARASGWFEGEGMLQPAVAHALAAGEHDRAAALVERVAETVWKHNDFATLRSLLDALPDEIVRVRPKLCLFHAWIRLVTGHFAAGQRRLEEAERAIAQSFERGTTSEADLLHGGLFAIQSTLARANGDPARSDALAVRALALLPPDETLWRGMCALNRGENASIAGNLPEARAAFAEAARLGERESDTFIAFAGLLGSAGVEEEMGHLHAAAAIHTRSVERLSGPSGHRLPGAGYPLIGLASLAYEWNRLEEAERLVGEGMALGRDGEVFDVLYNAHTLLASIRQARGDPAGALEAVAAAERLTAEARLSAVSASTVGLKIAILLAQGETIAAAHWADETLRALGGQDHRALQWVSRGLLPRTLIALGRHEEALDHLGGIVAEAESSGRATLLIQSLSLRAVALGQSGRRREALATLGRALALAEPEGFIRSFADLGAPMADLFAALAASAHDLPVGCEYLATLLGACGRGGAQSADSTDARAYAALSNLLSEREIEVLRLMAGGAANQAIARTLVVSIHTVKTHVAHILAKLHAANRTEAVARARELGLA